MEGTNWLVQFGNKKTAPIDVFITFGRFVHTIQGYEYSMNNNRIYSNSLYDLERTPQTILIISIITLWKFYSDDKYLLTNKLMKLFYLELWPKINRFNQDDFAKLNNDITVDKIYFNGEFDIYCVHGTCNNGTTSP